MYCAVGEILSKNSLLPGVADGILNACRSSWHLCLDNWKSSSMILELRKETCRSSEKDLNSFVCSGETLLSTAQRPPGAPAPKEPPLCEIQRSQILCSPVPLALQTNQLLLRNCICLRDKVNSHICSHTGNTWQNSECDPPSQHLSNKW